MRKYLPIMLLCLVGACTFAGDAPPGPIVDVAPWYAIVGHWVIVVFGGSILALVLLGFHKAWTALTTKFHLENLNAFESLAEDAVIKGIHWAESQAEQKALDSNGKVKPTGDQKFDMAMGYITQILGDPFVKQYGLDKLEKLIESVLAQNDMGPAGS